MFDFGRSKINFNISPAMTCHAFLKIHPWFLTTQVWSWKEAPRGIDATWWKMSSRACGWSLEAPVFRVACSPTLVWMLDPKTMPSYVVFTRELSSNQPSKFHFLNSTLGLAIFQDQKIKIYVLLFRGLQWFRLKIPLALWFPVPRSYRLPQEEFGRRGGWMLKLEISPTPKLCDVDRQINRFIGEKNGWKKSYPKAIFDKTCGTVFFLNGLFRWFQEIDVL